MTNLDYLEQNDKWLQKMTIFTIWIQFWGITNSNYELSDWDWQNSKDINTILYQKHGAFSLLQYYAVCAQAPRINHKGGKLSVFLKNSKVTSKIFFSTQTLTAPDIRRHRVRGRDFSDEHETQRNEILGQNSKYELQHASMIKRATFSHKKLIQDPSYSVENFSPHSRAFLWISA